MDSTVTITLKHEVCCNCHIPFGIEANHQANLRASHKLFYCPAGHAQHYTGESDKDRAARLEESLKGKEQQLSDERAARWRQERLKANALERARKMKKRIHAGVCPDCNRTFSALARHMATKHGAKR